MGTIQSGGTSTVNLDVVAGPVGSVTNEANVASVEGDTQPNNNATTVGVTVNPRQCAPSTPLGMQVVVDGPNRLKVTLMPRADTGAPYNRLNQIRFGPGANGQGITVTTHLRPPSTEVARGSGGLLIGEDDGRR